MSDKGQREKSIEQAQASGKAIAGLGLNAILPGSGSLAVRLGEHVAELVLDDRVAKLEDFHRRVFEGDLTDEEISERFRALDEKADFRHLVATMLADIEEEKTPIYAAVYIHLVENSASIETKRKRVWLSAVETLQHYDFWVLKNLVAGNWNDAYSAAEHRLASAGTVTLHSGWASTSLRDRSNMSVKPTTFGTQLVEVVGHLLGHS